MKKTILSLAKSPFNLSLPPISSENLMKSLLCPYFSVMEAPKCYFTLHFPCNIGIWLHSLAFLVNFM